ncbi:MAG: ABC transporter substrate-binding protein [Pseudomonadota bacterium]
MTATRPTARRSVCEREQTTDPAALGIPSGGMPASKALPFGSNGASRRTLLAGLAAFGLATPLSGIAPGRALALDPAGAKDHVRATIDEVLALVKSDGETGVKTEAFQAILEKRAALPQIARFAAGTLWREMSGQQQAAYTDAFKRYVASVYAARFQEYSGQNVALGAVSDRGKRGIEISSTVTGGGQAPVKVDWLVSDRPGRTVIADITIEGVSLLITQREEIAGIHQKQGGIDQMIAFLRSV